MTITTALETFRPLFERIAAGAAERDREGRQPHDEVRLLKEARLGALRLPEAEGGFGLSIEGQHAVLLELGAADSNLPQIWRNHVAFVEDLLSAQPGGPAFTAHWRARVAAGELIGGAWSERGTTSLLDLVTAITPDDEVVGSEAGGALRLDGRKFYSTGSIFADHASILAKGPGPDELSLVLVAADAPGVTLLEDWTGVGQRLTGSGTTLLENVRVSPSDVVPFNARAPYQEAHYQLNHLATLAGIARAAHRDLVRLLRERTRAYPQGLAAVPRDDGQLLATAGRVGSLASSAEASLLWAARKVDAVAEVLVADPTTAGARTDAATGDPATLELLRAATVAVYEAQLTVTDAALAASTLLYDALSSSALDAASGLDRHWRNARTVASHNPRVYKERIAGAWHVNATDPIAALWGGTVAAAALTVPTT